MKVLFLTVHILAVMVCFSTADLDWEKWPCDKQNERQSELRQQPLRRSPVQYVYTPYTHQSYVPVIYPPRAYVRHPYFSRVAWQKPYPSYMPLLPSIYPWSVVSRNLHPAFAFNPPHYAQLPVPSSPTNSPTTPIQTTNIPITNPTSTIVTPAVSSKSAATEDSAAAAMLTSPTAAQMA
ncbi:DNA-directed RNA polymerase II subunit RPB1-like [Trichosurus vulpecula]|uniref:DNA-directed RNA polymerase II subunit RPB1-like n=1 Tax=Trichosurus vulpecula TaxID=9337 RepID=UPI00186B44D9|nr:DNA-directed RNA polymerase II subunit RPB1-like [Trichosurus vulpecula]